jgi:hypothetical protein
MDLAAILGNAADQDKGRKLVLLDPFKGEPTGITFTIVGPDSERARASRLMLADELAEHASLDGRVSAEAREAARLNALARLVIGWDATEGDKPVQFTTINLPCTPPRWERFRQWSGRFRKRGTWSP